MADNHLESVFLKEKVLKEEIDKLKNQFGIEVSYFWDETKVPHLGEGWLVEYIILGITFGLGKVVKTFIEAPFKKLGDDGFKAICDIFKLTKNRFKRKKSLFFVKTNVKGRSITVLFDDTKLSDNSYIVATQQILENLTFLIENGNEFATEYYEGSLLIRYDNRCKDIMIYPSRFDIELQSGSLLVNSYGWAILDDPNSIKDKACRLDNLFLTRAIFHRSLGESTNAISYFDKAIQENPNNLDAHMEFGNTFYYGRKYQEAIDVWLRALEIKTVPVCSPEIYFNLGCSMVKLNNMRHAATMFKKALESGLNGELIKSDSDLDQFRRSVHYGEIAALLG